MKRLTLNQPRDLKQVNNIYLYTYLFIFLIIIHFVIIFIFMYMSPKSPEPHKPQTKTQKPALSKPAASAAFTARGTAPKAASWSWSFEGGGVEAVSGLGFRV